VARLRLAPVYVVVVRWSKDLFISFITFSVPCSVFDEKKGTLF
jgi:hypothetical protein